MRFLCSIILYGLLAPGVLAGDAPLHRPLNPNLTVVMDENLILPTAALVRYYARTSHTPLTAVVRTPNTENEIGQGLEAHMVISADRAFIEGLAAQGLTDVSSIHTLTRTRLALVTTNNSPARELFSKHISFAAIIYATPALPIYLETASTEAGNRAALLMHGYEFSDALATRAEIFSTRQEVLAALRKNDGLALMLAGDAAGEPNLTILSVLPDTLSRPVDYQAAVLASESMEDARLFADFMDSKKARELLARAGLEPAEPKR